MERTGILLAVVVALCWGGADIVATLAARRQGALTTTSISLVVSATMLVFFGLLAFSQLALSLSTFVESIGIGFLTGLMAAIGYFSLYRGLELGPLAIVSPVAAADGAVGAVLAVFLLHEGLSSWQVIMLVLIFLGILCASTNLAEVCGIVQKSGLRGLVAGGCTLGSTGNDDLWGDVVRHRAGCGQMGMVYPYLLDTHLRSIRPGPLPHSLASTSVTGFWRRGQYPREKTGICSSPGNKSGCDCGCTGNCRAAALQF